MIEDASYVLLLLSITKHNEDCSDTYIHNLELDGIKENCWRSFSPSMQTSTSESFNKT